MKEAKLYEDNQAVIACCKNKSIKHTRNMVDIRMDIIRERLKEILCFGVVNSLLNIADMFTKVLPGGTSKAQSRQLFNEKNTPEK